MRLVDLDGDGWNDLVVVGRGESWLYTYKNDGQGRFELAFETPVGRSPRDLISADLDGDGIPELIIACRVLSCLLIYTRIERIASGPGTFHFFNANAKSVSWVRT